jgi:hypothetical protein
MGSVNTKIYADIYPVGRVDVAVHVYGGPSSRKVDHSRSEAAVKGDGYQLAGFEKDPLASILFT